MLTGDIHAYLSYIILICPSHAFSSPIKNPLWTSTSQDTCRTNDAAVVMNLKAVKITHGNPLKPEIETGFVDEQIGNYM